MVKALDKDQIENLLKKQPKVSGSNAPKWPNDEDYIRLAKAVRDDQTEVTFGDGRRFLIRDAVKWNSVFIKLASGITAPCGYFDKDKLREVLKTRGAK